VQLGHPELTPVVFHNSYFGSGYGPIGYSSIGCGGWETAIGSCSNVTFPSFACGRDRTAGVLCGADCYNGQLRLMGGSDRTQGSVEVCFDNVWGNIAETGWGDKDAQLACSLMGFLADGAIPYYGSYYGKTSPTILITDLYCTGEEVNLFECTMTRHSVVDGRDLLGTQHVAGVQCMTNDTCIPPPPIGGSQCTTGDVQLSSNGLGSGSSGNLQYCYNGTWTPFCTLDRNTAIVACRKLGYADYTWATIYDDGRFMPSSNVSYFQNFTCQGVETSFSACTINDNCIQVCPVPYAIQCYDPIGCPEGAVRLVGGYIAQEGRVEVCMNGIWSGICADGAWGKVDALVVCNQLGLGIGEPMIYTDSSVYGEPYGPIVYSNVSCKGYETNVAQCVKATYPNIQCSRSQVAGLFCTDVCTDGDIKLVGGSTPNEGTVVVCKNKVWGLIAQTGWDVNDAKVVCNQLGYPTTGAMPVINSQYGKPNLTLQSSGVTCAGSESSINDCPATWLSLDMGKTIVSHVDVVGVYCSPGTPPPGCQLPPDYSTPVCTDGDVQFDGSSTTDGLLQYCYKGQWSYFCSIDAATANVACKQMGFNLYSWASLITNGQFGSGMGYTLFDSLTCSGSESTLKSCNIVDPGQCLTKCSVSMAIRCYQPGVCNEGDVRLADGAIPQRGRVEICKNGVWGTICDQGWDNSDAFSLCKGLGYYGKTSQAYSGSAFGAGYGPAIYSNLQCGGWENSTDACAKDTYPTISCSSDQTAGALCTSGCSDGSVRLVGGSSAQGTVEICYNNLWGLVDSFNWGLAEAQVVCNQLGFGTQYSTAYPVSPFGRPNITVHLTNIGCSGTEQSLSDCTSTKLDISDAPSYPTVGGVQCQSNRTTVVPSSMMMSNTSTMASTATPTSQSQAANSGITAAAAIFGVITLGLVVAVVV
jgi:deleted-in-malignant-brain-tumors protein 1